MGLSISRQIIENTAPLWDLIPARTGTTFRLIFPGQTSLVRSRRRSLQRSGSETEDEQEQEEIDLIPWPVLTDRNFKNR